MEPLLYGAVGAVFVALIAATAYLFRDNQKLRGIIRKLEAERNDLIRRVESAESTSRALLDVMKSLMRGEIRTARTEERAALFQEAYEQLLGIERGDVNVVNITGGTVGQAASGQGNAQES